MSNMDTELGNRIKQFRNRACISQLELEMRIETSPGSISRIENGQVNPTKETLLKIVEALDLNPFEYASIFNLHVKEIPQLVRSLNHMNSSLSFDQALQNTVDAIAKELNLTSAVFIVNESEQSIHSKTFNKTWFTDIVVKLVLKILGKKFEDVSASLIHHKDNLLIKTVNEKQSFYVGDLEQCTVHAYPSDLSKAVSKVIGFKSGITFPILMEDKCIGAMLYIANYETNFDYLLPILKAFNDHLSIALSNAYKYEQLIVEIQTLKENHL